MRPADCFRHERHGGIPGEDPPKTLQEGMVIPRIGSGAGRGIEEGPSRHRAPRSPEREKTPKNKGNAASLRHFPFSRKSIASSPLFFFEPPLFLSWQAGPEEGNQRLPATPARRPVRPSTSRAEPRSSITPGSGTAVEPPSPPQWESKAYHD